MPLDSPYLICHRGILFIKKVMDDYFDKSVILIDEQAAYHHHGWFNIKIIAEGA